MTIQSITTVQEQIALIKEQAVKLGKVLIDPESTTHIYPGAIERTLSRRQWLVDVLQTHILGQEERAILWIFYRAFSEKYPLPRNRQRIAMMISRELNVSFPTCRRAIDRLHKLGYMDRLMAEGETDISRDKRRADTMMKFIDDTQDNRFVAELRIIFYLYYVGIEGKVMIYPKVEKRCFVDYRTFKMVVRKLYKWHKIGVTYKCSRMNKWQWNKDEESEYTYVYYLWQGVE